jgi:two-component system CheB/CheR fusion protein
VLALASARRCVIHMSEQKRNPSGAVHRRILVIEDNVDAADTLREILEMEGHTVDVAYSGTDGVEKARSLCPEVILCDIGLPDMDGHAVARSLRQDPRSRDVLLVALSGFTRSEDIERARAAGFDQHLAKPPDLDVLERLLAAPLSR